MNEAAIKQLRTLAEAQSVTTCDCCGKPSNSVTGEVTKAGLLICADCQIERESQQQMTAEAQKMLPGAVAIAGHLGPLRMATDDSACGLAAAHANDGLRQGYWCQCRLSQLHEDEVYYRNINNGSHGWMCAKCRGIRQTG